jgi:hypothetical protein
MPSHGKSKVQQAFGPKNCLKCPTGYVGSTTHRGTVIASSAMHKLLETRKLPHTDWYRSGSGVLYEKRKYPKNKR